MNRSLSLVAVLASSFSLAAAAADGFSFSVGSDYSSGKYGNDVSTDVLAVPLSARYDSGAFTYKLTVPYLEISGPGNVIGVGGNGSAIVVAGSGTNRGRVSGLGDVVAGVNYNAYYDAASGVVLDVGGKIKFATADSGKGLGTGKSDQSLQLDAFKIMGKATLMGTLGYKWMGKPEGSQFRDLAFVSAGFAWQYQENLSLGAIVDFRQSVLASRPDQVELTLYAMRALDKHWKLQGYVYGGGNSASPDTGLGVSVSYRY